MSKKHTKSVAAQNLAAVAALPGPASTVLPEVQAPAADQAATPSTPVQETQAPANPPKVVLYTIAAPKRPLTGTHFGKGNAYVHNALCEAAKANGGTLTWEQILEVCTRDGLNHKSFATYALKRLKVISPVVAA